MRHISHIFISILLAVFNCQQSYSSKSIEKGCFVIETIYEFAKSYDPLVNSLINSSAMHRLKAVHQYGVSEFLEPAPVKYSRYQHSLGVYYILNKVNVSRTQQIAGLLHDISHTNFSHSTDILFKGNSLEEAYQDTIFEKYLERYGIKEILEKEGITCADVNPKNESFKALEQSLPNLCADRIEYNLYAGYMDELIKIEERAAILKDLKFDGNNWYFTDKSLAKKFALIPLDQNVRRWQSANSILWGNWISKALLQALEIGLITIDDLHFSYSDDEMWKVLNDSQDTIIQQNMQYLNNSSSYFKVDENQYDTRVFGKFRGVDPYVLENKKLKRLTAIDIDFKNVFTKAKENMAKGWPIQWLQGTIPLPNLSGQAQKYQL